MAALDADCGGQRGETQVERRELRFDAAFLFFIREGLPYAGAAEV
jgi:hypothetical protein